MEDEAIGSGLLAGLGEDLPPAMRDFIGGPLAADQRRRQRRTLMTTTGGSVVALTLAGLAGWQWREARQQRDRATHSLTPKFNSEAGNVFPDQLVTGVLWVLSTTAGP